MEQLYDDFGPDTNLLLCAITDTSANPESACPHIDPQIKFSAEQAREGLVTSASRHIGVAFSLDDPGVDFCMMEAHMTE